MIKLFKVKEKQKELAESANGKSSIKKQSAGELRLHRGIESNIFIWMTGIIYFKLFTQGTWNSCCEVLHPIKIWLTHSKTVDQLSQLVFYLKALFGIVSGSPWRTLVLYSEFLIICLVGKLMWKLKGSFLYKKHIINPLTSSKAI